MKQKRIIGLSIGIFMIAVEIAMFVYTSVVQKLGWVNKDNQFLLTYIGNSISIYLVGIIVLGILLKKIEKVEPKPPSNLGFGKLLYLIMITIGGAIGITFATSMIKMIIELVIPGVTIGNRVTDIITQTSPILLLFFVAFLGPICEEIIFRGMFLKRLRVYGDKTAIIYTAILFGLFHANFMQIPMAIAVGLVLGYAAVKTNKLIYPIIIHIAMNFTTSMLTICMAKEYTLAMSLIVLMEMGFALATIISLPIILTSKKHKLDISNESKYDRKKLYFNAGYIFSVLVVIILTVLAIIIG